jgi:integrase/recombinase XerD
VTQSYPQPRQEQSHFVIKLTGGGENNDGYRRLRSFHDKPLFQNARKQRLSRSGIRDILQKYLVKARNNRPSLNRTVSPNTLRHTKGMHLLQSGISLDMIRDFLGHVDVKTTQIYARANLEMKRNALEKIDDCSPVQTIPCWQENKDLLAWLRSS